MYQIVLSKKASKFLQKISAKHAKQIVAKIDLLAQDLSSVPTKKLKGFDEYHRATSGEYRIIFKIYEGVLIIHIVLIGKRNGDEIYTKFSRLIQGLELSAEDLNHYKDN